MVASCLLFLRGIISAQHINVLILNENLKCGSIYCNLCDGFAELRMLLRNILSLLAVMGGAPIKNPSQACNSLIGGGTGCSTFDITPAISEMMRYVKWSPWPRRQRVRG